MTPCRREKIPRPCSFFSPTDFQAIVDLIDPEDLPGIELGHLIMHRRGRAAFPYGHHQIQWVQARAFHLHAGRTRQSCPSLRPSPETRPRGAS